MYTRLLHEYGRISFVLNLFSHVQKKKDGLPPVDYSHHAHESVLNRSVHCTNQQNTHCCRNIALKSYCTNLTAPHWDGPTVPQVQVPSINSSLNHHATAQTICLFPFDRWDQNLCSVFPLNTESHHAYSLTQV